ncbi:MAG: dockerin type I repeat-containing protein, partial [Clostridia bacterium]|nr:dockerin type I repeat-containing protein [Clostridia bacterium]
IAATNIIGDVDGDTSVTTADALRILRNSVGIESFDEMQQINADVNFDNEIDSLDALEVLRKTVNLISDF